MQDIRNRNLVFMKFGREYIQPSSEQVNEYENSLTSENSEAAVALESQNAFTKHLNSNSKGLSQSEGDLLLDEIPKKNQNLNKPNDSQFSNKTNYNNNSQENFENTTKINKKQSSPTSKPSTKLDTKSSLIHKNPKSSTASTDNSDSEALSSNASLGRLFNNYYQHSFLPNGITDTKLIHSLILFLKKDLKLEQKHEISITLARTSNNSVLQRFLEFEGAEILSNWLHEIKEKIQDLPTSSTLSSKNYLNNILLNLLIFCEKLKISLKDLKFSKIGKEVNKIAKLNLDNKKIHAKCVALVHKWKKIVEETKEGKKPEVASANSPSGFDSVLVAKSDEDKSKKTDMNQSLLKAILSEEAEKHEEIAERSINKEQDRNAFELLNRKKHHPDREVKDKEKDNDKDRDREHSSINAHDKNNKKYIFKFSFIKDFCYEKLLVLAGEWCVNLFLFLIYFCLMFF